MLKEKFKKSIRFKFLVVMSIILFASTVVLSTAIALNEREMLKNSLMSKGQGLASYIAKLCVDLLIMKDGNQLDAMVNEVNKDEDVFYTIIQDAQGNIVTSLYASINYRSPRLKPILLESGSESELQNIISAIPKKEAVIILSVPVVTGADMIGKVTVCMSKQIIRRQMIKTILFVIALNMVVAFVLGAVLFVSSKKMILTPVAELAIAAARLAKGDLSTQVVVKATGELQMLVDSFNQMAGDLEKTTVSRRDFQRQTDFLNDVVESLSQPFYVIDVNDYSIKLANSAAAALGEWRNSTCHALIHKSKGPCETENHTCPVEIVKKTKKPVVLEHVHYDKYGSERIFEVHGYPIFDSNGNVVQMTEHSLDITDRKRAEDDLKKFSTKLEEKNQELQNFAYIASHDLQEPLRKVMGFGDRLKAKYGDVLDEQGRDYLERMQGAAVRMQSFIDDLLTFSRITTKAQPFASVDLETVAREVLSDLEVRLEQVNGRVDIGDLPVIDADPLQMRQLFQNLIGNALKFHKKSDPPVVKVSGRMMEEHGSGSGPSEEGLCRITVEDNGIGFEQKYAERIFDLFQRLHGRGEYEGSGMGLAICKKIVERHNGSISAKGSPGQGAAFTVVLPVKQRD